MLLCSICIMHDPIIAWHTSHGMACSDMSSICYYVAYVSCMIRSSHGIHRMAYIAWRILVTQPEQQEQHAFCAYCSDMATWVDSSCITMHLCTLEPTGLQLALIVHELHEQLIVQLIIHEDLSESGYFMLSTEVCE
jgi:hypothetical protein